MKSVNLSAYNRILENFKDKGFSYGKIISFFDELSCKEAYYVEQLGYCRIAFSDIPKEALTRFFFIHALSGVQKDVLDFVKAHLGEMFDREFFKDHISSNNYALVFSDNCFDYMPIEYIDEEMVSLAILKSVGLTFAESRNSVNASWFYSVFRRKPELLTRDFWILGARLYAQKRGSVNEFLSTTPDKYKTEEYYYAMCLGNRTPVMEDIPKSFLTTEFLSSLISANINNVLSFSEDALEQVIYLKKYDLYLKCWQIAILGNGYLFSSLKINDERRAFFRKIYGKNTPGYVYADDHFLLDTKF